VTNEMKRLLEDLRDVIKNHEASIFTTIRDDGLYIKQGDEAELICIGYIFDGRCNQLDKILE
jgi:hypothetical protein